jgi:hypothetical protein
LFTRIAAPLGRHRLLTFFALACAITWPGWWLEATGSPSGAFLGCFGAAIASILVAAISGGRERLGELLARLFQWRVPFRWYLIAVLQPLAWTFPFAYTSSCWRQPLLLSCSPLDLN